MRLASPKRIRLLHVEHTPEDVELAAHALRDAGMQVDVDVAATRAEFLEKLHTYAYDVVLADFRLPQWSGLDAFRLMHKEGHEIPFILVTGTLGDVAAVECIKEGVTDYVLKDHLARLPSSVERALEQKWLREEKARAETLLRESEERHRALFENAVYGMYQASPDGRFLHVNPALVRILGYGSKDEVLALHLPTGVYRDPADWQAFLDRLRAQGTVEGVEVEWKRKDKQPILVRLSGRAILKPDSAIDYNEIIAEDITERRSLEKRVSALQKFEAIGRLAGGIAHDFNNVLAAIIGWAELALEELPKEAKLRSHLEKIRFQADRAAALTRQLLAFARRQILEPRNMSLNQSVSETMGLLEKVIGKNVAVSTRLAPDLAVTRADPSQLEQVLMNLCLNARDAMSKGGRLVIETKNVVFDEEYCRLHNYVRPGSYVLLSVSDTGIGMDAKTIEHIFEPFFSTKEVGKGTGLGLATVFGIVKQHGGFVNAYSEPGHGTTFRIYLPAIAGAPDVEAPVAVDRPRGGNETILVAEDHDGVRELIQETLAKHGYKVLMAQDGEQAVEMFRAQAGHIALLLFDVVMPRMGGPEAHARIAELRPGVPVIFSSGYSSEVTQLSAAIAQGATILQKPFTPSVLARKVREALDAAKKP